MTYYKLLRDADSRLDEGEITLGEYEQIIKPLFNEVCDIEQIRAEIEETAKDYDKFDDYRRMRGLWIALDIIGKYTK